MKTLNDLFYDVILLNELGGNTRAMLRFSDPDGPSGRSGWSFGVCQFDTKHNDQAIKCLKECGFTQEEIDGIIAQDINVKPLASKLNISIVEKYDKAQLAYCLFNAVNTTTSNGIMAVSTGPILALADYVNQYGSIGPSFIEYLNARDEYKPLSIEDIQEWKLKHTKYGREHPADCVRRYNNILKVLGTV